MTPIQKVIEKIYLNIEDNLVYYDSVTKCRTRLYYDTVAKQIYQQKECYVIFVDVDGLKSINDTQGHSYGTQVIKDVGANLLDLDDVYDVCRIGGDEFVIFAKPCFDTNILQLVNNVSYGYYLKEMYEDVSSAVHKADNNMYQMKAVKKNGQSR